MQVYLQNGRKMVTVVVAVKINILQDEWELSCTKITLHTVNSVQGKSNLVELVTKIIKASTTADSLPQVHIPVFKKQYLQE